MNDYAVYRSEDVRALLDYEGCIAAVRRAMAALSVDTREQPLRTIIPVSEGCLFGLMPGMAAGQPGFGAKLITVSRHPEQGGRSTHKGVVALFEEKTGSVVCVADADEITRVRTACASAVATDALARRDAAILAVFGCGTQAESHIRAIPLVRPIRQIRIWGRNEEIAQGFAWQMGEIPEIKVRGIEVTAMRDGQAAAQGADIICATTAATEPVLFRDWVEPGTHINAVGSSHAGPVEIDPELVAASAYFVDYRRSALDAAAEFLRARSMGLVGDDHIRAEIGAVLGGSAPGRSNAKEITVYKSLGHIVQDLAAAQYIHDRALRQARVAG